MQTITQSWRIPKDRHVDVTLPATVPEGEAQVVLIIEPRWRRHGGSISDLIGTLSDSGTFAGDAVDMQRSLRDEWDRVLSRYEHE
jgi:hypothetical protein